MLKEDLMCLWTNNASHRTLPTETQQHLLANPAGSLANLESDLELFEQRDTDELPMALATVFTCTACATKKGCGC